MQQGIEVFSVGNGEVSETFLRDLFWRLHAEMIWI